MKRTYTRQPIPQANAITEYDLLTIQANYNRMANEYGKYISIMMKVFYGIIGAGLATAIAIMFL